MKIKPNSYLCKGCNNFNKNANDCYFVFYVKNAEKRCPCLDCIIKTMCDNACKKLFTFGQLDIPIETRIE